jgi:hypothetical protein
MTPDFEYLLRLEPAGRFGHTALGLVTFCLPLGFLAWTVFHALVAPALLSVAPPGLAATLEHTATAQSRDGGGPARAALAVLLGAVSHVTWDGFTHGHGWAVAWLPSLRSEVVPALVPGLVWFKLLQHVSTVAGSIVVLASIGRWLGRQPRADLRFAPGQWPRTILAASFLLGATAAGALANGLRGASRGAMVAPGFAAVGAMAALAIALLAYGLAARYSARPRRC